MYLKYLLPFSFLVLTACRTTKSSSLKEDEISVKPQIKFSTSVVSLKTFKDYDPGPLETSSTFPRLYVLLPKLTALRIKTLSISGKILGSNGFQRSIVAQYDKEKWSSIATDLKYLQESLLGVDNPKLELTISGSEGNKILVTNYDLTQQAVINPFVDLLLLNIDFSNIAWQTKAGGPEAGKIKAISLDLRNDENATVFRGTLTPDFTKPEIIPDSINLLFAPDQLKKIYVKGTTIGGSADGTAFMRGDFSLGKIIDIIP